MDVRRFSLLIIRSVLVSALCLPPLAALPEATRVGPIDYQVIHPVGLPRSTEPIAAVIRSLDEWRHWLSTAAPNGKAGGGSPTEAPDFNHVTLIVVSLGLKTTTSEWVSIGSVARTATGTAIAVLDVTRHGKCVLKNTFHIPTAYVLIPKTDDPIRFSRIQADVLCPSVEPANRTADSIPPP